MDWISTTELLTDWLLLCKQYKHLRCFSVPDSVNLLILSIFNFLSDEEMQLWFKTILPTPQAKYIQRQCRTF